MEKDYHIYAEIEHHGVRTKSLSGIVTWIHELNDDFDYQDLKQTIRDYTNTADDFDVIIKSLSTIPSEGTK